MPKVGLVIYPNFFPQQVQIQMLERLLHRDLANPQHQTNVHLHYDVSYPPDHASFFNTLAQHLPHVPKETHAPLTTRSMLNKRLRWMTLGGQYDWTNKRYPDDTPPAFPRDIKLLLEDIFPMKAEAAIVNLYSPGDTLAAHRDVSEACAQPLVSISLGCEAIFIVAVEDPASSDCAVGTPQLRTAAIRLRSGDAVLMSSEARYAWHGVPKVLAGTCPESLRDWPAVGSDEARERYEGYRGWMAGKRVNVNVRQMFDA